MGQQYSHEIHICDNLTHIFDDPGRPQPTSYPCKNEQKILQLIYPAVVTWVNVGPRNSQLDPQNGRPRPSRPPSHIGPDPYLDYVLRPIIIFSKLKTQTNHSNFENLTFDKIDFHLCKKVYESANTQIGPGQHRNTTQPGPNLPHLTKSQGPDPAPPSLQ